MKFINSLLEKTLKSAISAIKSYEDVLKEMPTEIAHANELGIFGSEEFQFGQLGDASQKDIDPCQSGNDKCLQQARQLLDECSQAGSKHGLDISGCMKRNQREKVLCMSKFRACKNGLTDAFAAPGSTGDTPIDTSSTGGTTTAPSGGGSVAKTGFHV